MRRPPDISEKAEAFITRWQGQEGGQERANYALFLTELCDVLGLAHPDPADARHERNDYVFERVVTRHRGQAESLERRRERNRRAERSVPGRRASPSWTPGSEPRLGRLDAQCQTT